MVTTSDVRHRKLEEDVKEFLISLGFLTTEATYHSVMPPEIVSILQNIYTPTALYLRGRADRIAIHPELKLVFEWEAKTHQSTRYHDMTLEALPMCHHLSKAQLDVECLYCYYDPHMDYVAGFWVHELPPVRVIMIPDRWGEKRYGWFKKHFEKWFPGVSIHRTRARAGTGDPFLIIDESVVAELHTWQELIQSCKGDHQ